MATVGGQGLPVTLTSGAPLPTSHFRLGMLVFTSIHEAPSLEAVAVVPVLPS